MKTFPLWKSGLSLQVLVGTVSIPQVHLMFIVHLQVAIQWRISIKFANKAEQTPASPSRFPTARRSVTCAVWRTVSEMFYFVIVWGTRHSVQFLRQSDRREHSAESGLRQDRTRDPSCAKPNRNRERLAILASDGHLFGGEMCVHHWTDAHCLNGCSQCTVDR